ncbi:MAG TPA: ATP-binding cassette domain-containing protein [Nordella sp.]|nr:ATP-binding cassette domain-containing protein [Nordella sp.]
MAEPAIPLIEAHGLRKEFRRRGGGTPVVAVDDVSLSILPGQTFGLAGTSAAGKSTIGRIIMGLTPGDAGEIFFEGKKLPAGGAYSREVRARMQMVFQNPALSMNPRRTAAATIELPMQALGVGTRKERRERVAELLNLVGLSPRHAHYYPHEFSGGQCQRLGIARALASTPRFVFLDEPVSALDVSIQAQILNLLKDLQERLALTYLFVANNLNVTRFMCDHLAIVHRGRIIESGSTDEIFEAPKTDHSKKLLSALI